VKTTESTNCDSLLPVEELLVTVLKTMAVKAYKGEPRTRCTVEEAETADRIRNLLDSFFGYRTSERS
jgi:hypothetical protein